jgi:hypothetical protein
MLEQHNTVAQSIAFFEPDSVARRSLGNRLTWQDKMKLFHQHCRYHLCNVSEASLAALWISIFQHSQQQQHCLSHHVPS